MSGRFTKQLVTAHDLNLGEEEQIEVLVDNSSGSAYFREESDALEEAWQECCNI